MTRQPVNTTPPLTISSAALVLRNADEANVDFDFTTLQLTESNLLQATLAFPGTTTSSLSLPEPSIAECPVYAEFPS
jgi:hypothetical protein